MNLEAFLLMVLTYILPNSKVCHLSLMYRTEAKFGLFQVDRDDDDDNNFNLRRKNTKGAEAYKLIIKESVNQSREGAVTHSAISKAEHEFGSFSPDGFNIYTPK